MVTSVAACISAISAAVLIIRQPRTTGSADTSRAAGRAWARPSLAKKRTVSSMPTVVAWAARSVSASSASGLSSSCQTRTSAGMPRLWRTDGASKNGVMTTGSPRAGITASVSRSLRCQWTPVK